MTDLTVRTAHRTNPGEIRTQLIGPRGAAGSKVQARLHGRQLTVPYDHALGAERAMQKAAERIARGPVALVGAEGSYRWWRRVDG